MPAPESTRTSTAPPTARTPAGAAEAGAGAAAAEAPAKSEVELEVEAEAEAEAGANEVGAGGGGGGGTAAEAPAKSEVELEVEAPTKLELALELKVEAEVAEKTRTAPSRPLAAAMRADRPPPLPAKRVRAGLSCRLIWSASKWSSTAGAGAATSRAASPSGASALMTAVQMRQRRLARSFFAPHPGHMILAATVAPRSRAGATPDPARPSREGLGTLTCGFGAVGVGLEPPCTLTPRRGSAGSRRGPPHIHPRRRWGPVVTVEHFDVVVVGAGISGIGAGYHLQTKCPDRTYAILEGRDDLGGTWDLFRYPGVRSDSDMHTLGYSFKPWTAAKAIADGPSILEYLRETAGRVRHRPPHPLRPSGRRRPSGRPRTPAGRSRPHRTDTGETVSLHLRLPVHVLRLLQLQGRLHARVPRHRPTSAARSSTPRRGPTTSTTRGKQVVVIGSGATAMTLVPAMADTAGHVTMLQRSPTYVVSRPDTDAIANALRKVLPEKAAYDLTRSKNVALQQCIYKRTRTQPEKVKAQLLGMVRKELGPDYDVDTHFTPSYNPWDQRLCLVPNSDLFKAIRSGQASVVTDEIVTFTETGIELASGEELDADIIVTATGLQLVTLGEMDFVVDGEPVDFSKTWTYKGFAYCDIPNLASSFGYINASWTLRADLICEYVCRLLNHMAETGTVQCTPRLRPSDRSMPERPWIDGFSAGYMQRVMHRFPQQGDREPWINPQNYTARQEDVPQGARSTTA